MKVAIVKYNAGNVQSVIYALNRLGIDPIVTDDPDELKSADKVIFPGVGEAASAMKYLKEKNLDTVIKELTQPVLGICLGLQLLCKHSEERDTECLGIFDVEVKRFPSSDLKVPQIGWNRVFDLKSPLFKDVDENSYVYFVHSFYAAMSDNTIAQTDYATNFSASLSKDNFHAVQFHPEKSSTVGSKILENFIHHC
ncbi:imidazole glycerol phosphate synthase subunit HisH [Sediminitomix flava]|uniref:Imidazole glycerol phosphate synthase subunit HisH n=1 Tax=Sediminitomix flava TaxID=379075 RepID=A0A315ZEH2_SEDFL|nr:imidazole glycerol phosphate synthase subunit HisH [Sediminitomix flava]PWJ44006.1 imidazole glycerol phosphate synthase subunit HisH [Sediminitomix flava]